MPLNRALSARRDCLLLHRFLVSRPLDDCRSAYLTRRVEQHVALVHEGVGLCEVDLWVVAVQESPVCSTDERRVVPRGCPGPVVPGVLCWAAADRGVMNTAQQQAVDYNAKVVVMGIVGGRQ
jgi:hypothetical protein